MSDAVGTVAGAALGTSTVTSFIESAAGVEQGGRTGPDGADGRRAVPAGPVLQPDHRHGRQLRPDHRPGAGGRRLDDDAERDEDRLVELRRGLPAFLVIVGIPLTYSIADGLALGFITYPIVKLLAGQGRDVKWLMYVMAAVLVAYFVLVRAPMG